MNALFVWGLARATGRRILLRIEDHDRQRSRPEFDAAILEDLAWLGFAPDVGPVRQSDQGPAYEDALRTLRDRAPVYACDCSRATFAAWGQVHGRRWQGPGCPGGCRDRAVRQAPGVGIRVALPPGEVTWDDLLLGPRRDEPARDGDLLVRDRAGNWTYPLCVVVDDRRQEIDLVIRGEDLVDATGRQVALGRLLGRDVPPTFAHHPLVRKRGGAKLSKADGDTSIRDLRAAGLAAADVIGRAAAAAGLVDRPRPLAAMEAADLAASTAAPR